MYIHIHIYEYVQRVRSIYWKWGLMNSKSTGSVLQCVVACCSALMSSGISSSVLQRSDELRKRQGVAMWCSVSVCCSVVQCGAVWRSVMQCGAVWCIVLQCGAVWCRVVQCVAVWCSVLQLTFNLSPQLQGIKFYDKTAPRTNYLALHVWKSAIPPEHSVVQRVVAICCSVLQGVSKLRCMCGNPPYLLNTAWCSVLLQCVVAVCCSVLQCVAVCEQVALYVREPTIPPENGVLQCVVAVWCSVLQCVSKLHCKCGNPPYHENMICCSVCGQCVAMDEIVALGARDAHSNCIQICLYICIYIYVYTHI